MNLPVKFGAVLIGLVLVLPISALAQDGGARVSASRPDTGRLQIREGGAVSIASNVDVKSVIVSNEASLSVDVRNTRQIVVFGKKEGYGEVILLNANDQPIASRVFEVIPDGSGLQSLLRQSIPGSNITVAKTAGVVVLSGSAQNPAQVSLATDIATSASAGAKILNLIKSAQSDQVAVSVRILEVRKSKVRELGIRWSAQNKYNQGTGSIGNLFASNVGLAGTTDLFAAAKFTIDRLTLDSFINFLKSEGAATTLAEPTIVATNKEKARFMAGGEIAVPTPQYLGAGTAGVASGYAFKPYGISLEFTATILDDDNLLIHVAPEVSAIDDSRVVDFGGAKVPGLVTRKADTTVTLKYGESLSIAGLRANETQLDKRGLPFSTPFNVGDALAGANNRRINDTELVLILTPQRVSEDQQSKMPSASGALSPVSK